MRTVLSNDTRLIQYNDFEIYIIPTFLNLLLKKKRTYHVTILSVSIAC